MPTATIEAPDRPEGAADDEISAEALAAIAGAAHGEAVGTQLTLDAGGEVPTTSEFKLAGRSLELDREYAKGETLVLRVGIKFGEVDFIDHEDKETGQVVKTIRRHKGKIVSYDVES